MRYFSAFAGIGGFDQGIKQAYPDAECVGYSEVDKYAIKIYEKHFPNRINYGDITRIEPRELPDFDMFCGGFPCQDLSIAGKRAGLCGARSGLFFEIIRIIREKQPLILFLENVKGLFSSNRGWDFARILIELDDTGYDVEWQCLNSKNFGVPQNRERVFIIGHLRGKPWKPVFPIGKINKESNGKRYKLYGEICTNETKYEEDVYNADLTLSQDGENGHLYSRMIIPTIRAEHHNTADVHFIENNRISPMRWRRTEQGKENRRKSKEEKGVDYTPFNEGNRMLVESEDDIVGCITNAINKDSLLGNKSCIRRLTPLECERLQGYPDGWTQGISDTQRYKCLGNAVTVNVIEAIVNKMVVCEVI